MLTVCRVVQDSIRLHIDDPLMLTVNIGKANHETPLHWKARAPADCRRRLWGIVFEEIVDIVVTTDHDASVDEGLHQNQWPVAAKMPAARAT